MHLKNSLYLQKQFDNSIEGVNATLLCKTYLNLFSKCLFKASEEELGVIKPVKALQHDSWLVIVVLMFTMYNKILINKIVLVM